MAGRVNSITTELAIIRLS